MSRIKPAEIEDARAVCAEFHERLNQRAVDRVEVRPRATPIASDINPESCLRRQVLEIVAWQEKRPIPAERQGRLEAGNDAEQKALSILRELRLPVIKEQVSFEIKHRKTGEPILRGRTEGFLEWNGTEVVVEVKSLAAHSFEMIRKAEDFENLWWTRHWPAQVAAYMIGFGHPAGIMILTNMAGDWRAIPVPLDYQLGERILAYAEAIVDAVRIYRATLAAGDPLLPDYTSDEIQCKRCPFFGNVCNPPALAADPAVEFMVDPELEAVLVRRYELWNAHREYDALDKRVKERLKRGPLRRVVGEFILSAKLRKRKSYAVGGGTYREWDIHRVIQREIAK